MIGQTWILLKESVNSFLEDEALTRGAAIAFYTVTSIGPVLFIVVAIAGLTAAAAIAWINSIGNLGGFFGPGHDWELFWRSLRARIARPDFSTVLRILPAHPDREGACGESCCTCG